MTTTAQQFEKRGEFFKADGKLIYGWCLVCETRKSASDPWEPYVDTQGDHLPEDVATDAALKFAKESRIGKEMHTGEQVAGVPLVYMITKSSNELGIETNQTGMLIAYEPDDPKLLESVANGSRTGFSIGGTLSAWSPGVGAEKIAKRMNEDEIKALAGKLKARVFTEFTINEISLVDRPAMEGALVGYVKNADGTVRKVIAKVAAPVTVVAKQHAITSITAGHQHTIDLSYFNGDGITSTSWQTAEGATNGHAHHVQRAADGTMTVLADSGHTHEIVSAAAPVAVATPELETKAAKERVDAEKLADKLYVEKTVADNHAWLDKLVSDGRAEHAIEIAKNNSSDQHVGQWGKAWLAKNGHTAEAIAKAAEPETLEAICKRNETRFEKAQRSIDVVVAKYATKHKVTKQEATYNLFAKERSSAEEHAEFAKAYEETTEAREAYFFGDVEKATKPLYDERARCHAESEKMVEAHQLAHNIEDVHKARAFLAKTSTAYKELVAKYSELGEKAQYVAAKLKVDTRRWHEKRHAEIEKAEQEAEAAAQLAKMSPSERALHDRIGAIAKERNVARPLATQWALTNDVTAQTLYNVVQTEKRRQVGY